MSAASRARQPWPMKWIVLTILVVLVPYTYITLHFRKTGKPFEPYRDMRDRANTVRLLSAGFQRITATAERPATPGHTGPSAATDAAPAGLPPSLAETLVTKPLLPVDIVRVDASPSANSLMPYVIDLTCTQPDHKQQLAGAQLYVREGEIWVTPEFENLDGSLLARTRDTVMRLTVAPGALKPGHYRITVLGSRSAKTWSLDVK